MNKIIKNIIALSLTFVCAKIFSQNKTLEYTLEGGESFEMVVIPGRTYAIGQTEMTQSVYEAVMEDNPSWYSSDNPAVDSVNWYDAVVFCNKLSEILGKTPVYSVNGETNPDEWDYEVHCAAGLLQKVDFDTNANGFRLPTEEEWEYAAKGGEDYKYAGSDDIEEIAWYRKNSQILTKDVAQKKPNGYGLYDMSGNVWEWVWDYYKPKSYYRVLKGGAVSCDKGLCKITFRGHHYPSRNKPCYSYNDFGFRIACNVE